MEEGAEGGQARQAGPADRLTTLVTGPVTGLRRHGDRLARAGELLGAAAVTLWLTRSFWLPGRFVVAFDTIAYSGPNYRVTTAEWRAGRLPLWNDLIFGGVTHAGNPQTGTFSPTKLLGLWFDTNRAMNLTVALHLVFMALTAVLLLRRLGARPPAAFVGAVVVVANGATLARSIQFEQVIVLAWLPALLWGITVVLSAARRPWGAMAATAAVVAMAIVAGHPQITYQVAFAAGAWVVAIAWREQRWVRLGDLAVAVAVGAVASSIHLLGALAATRDSAIGAGRDLDDLASPLLSTRPEFLVQSLLGSVRRVADAPFAGGFESIAHVGVVAALLTFASVAVLVRDPRTRPIAVVGAVVIVLTAVWALGPRTPVFRLAYDWLPGFDLARGSARWLGIATVVVGILVGLGLERLRATSAGRAHRAHLAVPVAATAITIVLAALGAVEWPGAGVSVPWLLTAAVVIGLLATSWYRPAVANGTVAALAALVVLELAAVGRHSSIHEATTPVPFDRLDPGPAAELAGEPGLAIALTDDAWHDTGYLVAGFRPNTNVLAGVASLDGYDGGVQVTERFAALMRRLTPEPDVELPLRNNLPPQLGLDLATDLGVRWALVDDRRDAEALLPGWIATDLADGTFSVWENPAWLGDAVMADADGLVRPAPVDHRSPGHLVVDVAVDPGLATPRTLTVHRQTAPGWTATVDGRRAELAAGDGFFLTVELPADAARVELRFRPRWVTPGLVLSGIGVLAIAAMGAVGAVGGRARRDPAQVG